jgi:hypothetical protein
MNAENETGCCPRFNPELWDGKEVTWNNKLFVKDRVTSLFHIPINFGKVITRNMKKIDRQKALEQPPVVLSDETSPWGSDMYIAVTQNVSEATMDKISGTFLARVYEGPYQDVRKWCQDMGDQVKAKGRELKKIYCYYTTCPKCAKAYGKNYVVLFAQVG